MGAGDAHREVGVVEVVQVAILDPKCRVCIVHNLNPRVYRIRILASGPLMLIYTIIACL